MRVLVKDIAPCEKALSIAVTGDLIQKEYEDFFEKVGPEARVPGFRPGKAPREVLRTHFKEQAREKVLEKLISRSFREAIDEKKLEYLGRPAIREVEFTDQNLNYEAHIEVAPLIKLGKYKGLTAKKPPIEVKREEVDEALERVRESLTKFVAVEDRTTVMGDFVIADYVCLIDGKEVEKRENDWFELREEEFLKGFSGQLVGTRPGEQREVKIHLPENFGRKECAGKEAIFQVKVREVKAKRLPPVDDELAKETGEFQTLVELRKHLEVQLEAERAREAETELENNLLDSLLKEHPFDIPKGFVERRQTTLANSAFESLQRRGVADEVIKKDANAIFDKFKPEAERQVRLSFLLDEIAKKEGVQLTEEDFESKFKEVATRHRQSLEPVRKYYAEHPAAKESLGIQIQNEKVIQLIKEHAKSGRES